ncbi:MAG: cytochrome c maturation protein CcmE [Bacillota bacterium]|nr:cytochrome c maturation protein CcmE [Bacillota bacterium]
MKKNTIVLLGSFIIAGAIVFLLMAATPGSSGIELSMKQLVATQDQHKSDFVTVQGELVEKTIKWDPDKIQLKFDVKESGETLHVTYNGVKPDNFSDGVICILKGSPTGNNHFKAQSLETRCPSKYEGKSSKNYDPKTHEVKK